MKSHWRKLAALLPLKIEQKVYHSYFKSLNDKWEKDGRPSPPSHLSKQRMIRHYAQEKNLSVLVETGTYLGDMVFAMQDQFQQIVSIELSHHFFKKAVARFKNLKKITIIEGDSGRVLKEIVPKLKEPALFWLDGHYSGGQTAKGDKECPVYEELKNILSSPFDHTILIDDARLFIGQNDYPTIEELKQFVIQLKPAAMVSIENDAIIITSKRGDESWQGND